MDIKIPTDYPFKAPQVSYISNRIELELLGACTVSSTSTDIHLCSDIKIMTSSCLAVFLQIFCNLRNIKQLLTKEKFELKLQKRVQGFHIGFEKTAVI